MDKELFDPPVIVRSVDALVELAGRINAEHADALSAARVSLIHARNAGLLLLEAKKQCGHGQWLPWIKANVKFSERTAQAYMRVAKRWPELETKTQATADLTIEDGLKLLAAPKDECLESLVAFLEKTKTELVLVRERLQGKIMYYPFVHAEDAFDALAALEHSIQGAIEAIVS